MRIQFLRGNTDENNQLVLPEGQLTVDLEKKALRIHDGITPGGYEVVGIRAYEPLTGPGPQELLAGDDAAGFYGEVPVERFITGDALALEVGLSSGIAQHSNEPWLKFALDHKVLFVAKKTFRYDLPWTDLNKHDLVYGNRTLTVGQHTYKIRLLRGSNQDPSLTGNGPDTPTTHGSEWNRLLYHIVLGDGRDVFDSEGTHGDWYPYPSEELGIADNLNGRYSFTQETWGGDRTYVIDRGGEYVSYQGYILKTKSSKNVGWRPVLELVG